MHACMGACQDPCVLACMLSNELLKEATLYHVQLSEIQTVNHFINSLSVYHLKEHVMKEIQTALTADSQ